jgi:YbbR domain-containing protein
MKRGIFSNPWLKILSVLLSISLWFFVTYRGQSEMSLDIPVSFKNVPKGLEILKESVKNVTLNVRGHERLLKTLRPADVGVMLDLSGARRGENLFYFDKADIVVPRTVEVVRIDPTSAKITLDESLSKLVPVKASVIGTPERGYSVTAIEVKPASVTVDGSKTELARVAFLRTEPLDITGLDSDITQNAHLNPNGRNFRSKLSDVTVHITIRKTGK